MTEEQITKWMQERIDNRDFTDAAGLAKEFLDEHNITNVVDPEFSMTISAGFKLVNIIAGC